MKGSFIDSADTNAQHEHEIALQRLYERWVAKKTWRLQDQAIPLLLGLDPETTLAEAALEPRFSNLWAHAQHCVHQALLPVINQQDTAAAWEAKPLDIYKWATVSRLNIPGPLVALLEFMAKVLPPTVATDEQQDKLRILGAALAVLAAEIDQCQDAEGRVQPEKIIARIQAQQAILYGDHFPTLPIAGQVALLSQWLEKIAELN